MNVRSSGLVLFRSQPLRVLVLTTTLMDVQTFFTMKMGAKKTIYLCFIICHLRTHNLTTHFFLSCSDSNMERVFTALLWMTVQRLKKGQPLAPEGTLAAFDKKVSLEDGTS